MRPVLVYPLKSFPCWMWDYDHDGLLDIFVAPFNIKQYTAARAMAGYFSGDEVVNSQIIIYKNLGNNTFKDIAPEMKLEEPIFAMGGNYGDINNDGYWDFYLGTGTPNYSALVPNKMYLNKGGNSFSDVSYSSRLAHLQKGHGVSFGDIDNDGDQDIFHVIGGAFEGDVFSDALFVNPLKPGSHYLRVLFEGTSANRSCIGLKFKVSGNDENGKELEFYHTVSTGGSFGSSSLRQEIGLGGIKSNVRIEIEWPDAELSKQVIDNIELDKFIKITQGNPKVEYLNVKQFDIAKFES